MDYSDWVSLFYNISTTFNDNRHSTMITKVVLFQQCSECKKNITGNALMVVRRKFGTDSIVQPDLEKDNPPPPKSRWLHLLSSSPMQCPPARGCI